MCPVKDMPAVMPALRRRLWLVLGLAPLASGLVACRSASAKQVSLEPETLAWSQQAGSANIRGVGFSTFFKPDSPRSVRGHQVTTTCSGRDVQLIPQNTYTGKLVDKMFRHNRADDPRMVTVEVAQFIRHTTCDSEGQFAFPNVPAGAWYVVTTVGPVGKPGGVVVKDASTIDNHTTIVKAQWKWGWPPSWRHPPSLW